MASSLSLLPTLDSHHHHHHHRRRHHHHLQAFHFKSFSSFKFQYLSFPFTKSNRCNSNFPPPCFSTSQSPDPPSPSSPPSIGSFQNPPRTGRFLTNQDLQRLKFLDNFTYSCKLPSGYLSIRVMRDFELDMIVEMLAESFAESMLLPSMYLTLLGFLIKQYLIERRGLMPHAVTLIGFYREEGDGEEKGEELAGTIEVSFDRRGANASPPSPTPPKDCPYICNMTVKKLLRRRGIGWHLLKASEELISNMSSSRDVYLHCRMIDSAPFSMYKKAGYDVVKTDSFLILLTLQRRKHLMCKELPALDKPSETTIVGKEEATSSESLVFDEVVQNSIDMGE